MALQRISEWLCRPQADPRVLIVTGMPGAGKSAVLSRIVTTANSRHSQHVAIPDGEFAAQDASVSCAIHARGKKVIEIMAEVAAAASLEAPQGEEYFVTQIAEPIGFREDRFNIIIDALDEADDPRAIIRLVILPLCQLTSAIAQVVVGTRRKDLQGDLIRSFASAEMLIDLDAAEYFDQQDVLKYAEAALRVQDPGHPRNPYADSSHTTAIANRISEISGTNFLIAGVMAHYHRMYDRNVVLPGAVGYTATVSNVLNFYIDRLNSSECRFARVAMTALAFAADADLPLPLWRDAVSALGTDISEQQLAAFASTTGAAYLSEIEYPESGRTYRLFHPALNEALLHFRQQTNPRLIDERHIVQKWIATWRPLGWMGAPAYLHERLAVHAERAGLVDEIMSDDDYLLHADLPSVLQVASHATTPLAKARSRILQLSPDAADLNAGQRHASFAITEALSKISAGWNQPPPASYRAAWAQANPALEWARLKVKATVFTATCHFGDTDSLVVATGDEDGTIRLWEPPSASPYLTIESATAGEVTCLCPVEYDGGPALAAGSESGEIVIVDPVRQAPIALLQGHVGLVSAICNVPSDERRILVSAGHDKTLRLWDLSDGTHRIVCTGTDWLTCLEPLRLNQRTVLAAGDVTGRIQLWDLETGMVETTYLDHSQRVTSICAIRFTNGAELIASASHDHTIHIWDPRTGERIQTLEDGELHYTGLCYVQADDQDLVCASSGNTILIWNLASDHSARRFGVHAGKIRHLGLLKRGSQKLLLTAGEDGQVILSDPVIAMTAPAESRQQGAIRGLGVARLAGRTRILSIDDKGSTDHWDLETGLHTHVNKSQDGTNQCASVVTAGSGILATATGSLIHLWDFGKDQPTRSLPDHTAPVSALTTVEFRGAAHLISADQDGVAMMWDKQTWQPSSISIPESITCLEGWNAHGEAVAGIGASNGAIYIWRLGTRSHQMKLTGHIGRITSLATFTLPSAKPKLYLASGSDDGTIRIWNALTGDQTKVLKGHKDSVTSLAIWHDANQRTFLFSSSNDTTLRCWDIAASRCRLVLPLHRRCSSLVAVDGKLVAGLDDGLLAIEGFSLSVS